MTSISPHLALVAGFANLFIVMVHEAGHALLVRHFKFAIASLDIHGAGGACRWVGEATDQQRAIVAWGGVLAQAVLAVWLLAGTGAVSDSSVQSTLVTVSLLNLFLILFNLLPLPWLDGYEAWQLFRWFSLTALLRRNRFIDGIFLRREFRRWAARQPGSKRDST